MEPKDFRPISTVRFVMLLICSTICALAVVGALTIFVDGPDLVRVIHAVQGR